MKALFPISCLLYGLLMAAGGQGQGLSNIRSKKIPVSRLPLLVDSFPVVPQSLQVQGYDTSWYHFDARLAWLTWKKYPAADSVVLRYRVFPFQPSRPLFRYRYDSIADFFKAMPNAGKTRLPASRPLDMGSLTYTGSIGRSLSFGNAQDAVVNSAFNLQINGMLGDGIQLAAAISDNNIPIQPDGTTRQLNEFDRIWLQFSKKPWLLNLGDIDVRQQPTWFLSFFKRQQGVSFQTEYKAGKSVTGTAFVSGAIAKGKFTRNIFQGLEGNQGPYRLSGANNELFFMVLAGTERVFVDGIMLQRGEDQDYVINYNTAEISFTPKMLITRDKRIQVEFEYADRNYLNTLLYAGTRLNFNQKLEWDVAVYANTDAKNSPINQVLSTDQRKFLTSIGDSIHLAYFSTAVADSFDAGKILYVLTDTVVQGQLYTFYRYQPFRTPRMFQLAFSEVGRGRGNYIPLLNAANGNVFQWVPPVNGIPSGTHEPVSLLSTPKSQQMITSAVRYRLSDQTAVKFEAGYSMWDVNTYAVKDKGNDGSLGWLAELSDNRTWGSGSRKKTLQSEIRYEQVAADFRPPERLRSVEFLRDWGLPFEAVNSAERLYRLATRLGDSKQQIRYEWSGYLRQGTYSGMRHSLEHTFQLAGFQGQGVFRMTGFSGTEARGFFLRPAMSISKRFSSLSNAEAGVSYSLEHNASRQAGGDDLLPSAFSFSDWNAYLRGDGSKPNRWSLHWFRRSNQLPVQSRFIPLDVNNNIQARLELTKNYRHQLRLNTGFRILQPFDTLSGRKLNPDRTLLGRLEYLLNLAKGAVSGNLLYEAGAGQEQQRDFAFIEVPAGRGEYAWVDYNNDGIAQLNEFEVAIFPDQARYIRIFVPTNRFVKATYHTLNASMVLNPAAVWKKEVSGAKRWLSRFNAQFSLQASNKLRQRSGNGWLPVLAAVADTQLIFLNRHIANTVSYNRYSTRWGADFTQVHHASKALLTYGVESREMIQYQLRLRRNAGRYFTLSASGKTGSQLLATPNMKFDNRNFHFRYQGVSAAVTYTRGSRFRSAFVYRWDHKRGEAAGLPQLARNSALELENKWNVLQNGMFQLKGIFTGIRFTGTPQSTVAYAMLDALQPGTNWQWSADFTRRLANNIDLSFQYEGRKSGTFRVVHLGRASIRAVL